MYQYKLTFALENSRLPREMDRLVVSFLKAAAQSYSQDFYDRLYDKSKSIIKGYTFSYYLPGAKFLKEAIELERNEFSMFFSDMDQAELLSFFNGFQLMKHRKYPMNGNSLELRTIKMQHLNEVRENEIVIRMQSPLIVRRHKAESNEDMYYTCETEGFEEVLKENIVFFLDKMNLPVDADSFTVQIIKGKKVVVPVFGRNTDASLGIYKLTGSERLLNLLLLAGVGTRRSAGHGKFEIIG